MDLVGKHVVVTGAGSGIGRALVQRFAQERPRGLTAVDIRSSELDALAHGAGATTICADVGREDEILRIVETAEAEHGQIDVFCSNAGMSGPAGGPDVADEEWERLWNVNVMAHVWIARNLVPKMLARGEGCLFSTVSAAGLLMSPGHMAYSVTKHAALSVAECLYAQYGAAGLQVSCFCPQVVSTPMFEAIATSREGAALSSVGDPITPADAAEVCLRGIRDGRFLILSHPEVKKYAQQRAADHDRWLAGVQRLLSQPSMGGS